jgi:hypothetical protein
MPVDIEGIARAFMDSERRKRELPTRAENIEAKAAEALAQRKALAEAGLSETKLEQAPELFARGGRESTAKVGQAESAASASEALASLRAEQQRRVGDVTQAPGSTYFGVDAPEGRTAPQTEAQKRSGALLGTKLEADYVRDPSSPTGWKKVMKRVGEGAELNMKPGAGLLGREERMGKVAELVEELGGLATGINTVPGVEGRIVGNFRKIKAAFNMDPDVQLYTDSLAGAASQLAKAFGESGRLSDQDIQRTVNMFPRVGDSPEVSQRKLDLIDILVGKVFSTPPNSAEANTPLVDEVEAQLADLGEGDGVDRAKSVANAQGGGGDAPIVQRNKRTGEKRISRDGGVTWEPL